MSKLFIYDFRRQNKEKQISKLFANFKIRTVPTLNRCLSSIITRGKDKSKFFDRTNVVYQFECEQCYAVYVGETKRALKTQINVYLHWDVVCVSPRVSSISDSIYSYIQIIIQVIF